MRHPGRRLAALALCAAAIGAGLATTTATASGDIDVAARATWPGANNALAGHVVRVGIGAESYAPGPEFGVHVAATLTPGLVVTGVEDPANAWSCSWSLNTADCTFVANGGGFPGPTPVHMLTLVVQLFNHVVPASVTTTVTHGADSNPANDVATAAFDVFGGVQTTSRPPEYGTSQSVTFAWRVGPVGSRTECKLDGGAFQACSSPRTYHGLAAGAHTLNVRALDTGDPSPRTVSEWFYIMGPGAPDTVIDSGPSPSTTSRSASFSWHATQAGSRYQCSLDGGAFGSCSSPRTYNGLALGPHVFAVRAVNFASETDVTPATVAWTITS